MIGSLNLECHSTLNKPCMISIMHMEEKSVLVLRKCYVYKNKSGDVISRLFVCNKEGFRAIDKRGPLTKSSR